ncbi:MAG: hypothetical protein V1703_02025 [Candidatus Altiarchaeota archaeon]
MCPSSLEHQVGGSQRKNLLRLQARWRRMAMEDPMKIELKIGEKAYLEDSISILLTSFSHKRPYTGGPTKATAYISLTKDNTSEEIMLSVHGIQGKSESEDGLPDSERYDSKSWNGCEFRLTSFNYDKSIEIIVTKKK